MRAISCETLSCDFTAKFLPVTEVTGVSISRSPARLSRRWKIDGTLILSLRILPIFVYILNVSR